LGRDIVEAALAAGDTVVAGARRTEELEPLVAQYGKRVKPAALEPGGIRTNYARRAGQNTSELLPDYEASVGPILKLLQSVEGRQEGDPRKIADLIVQLANRDEVPLRLILGVDAEKWVQQAEVRRASEAEKWRHLTISTVLTMQNRILNC
jgi:NAD(P)-dependent dehydrogenase (short-subunit alcohol dehydrogenase family)